MPPSPFRAGNDRVCASTLVTSLTVLSNTHSIQVLNSVGTRTHPPTHPLTHQPTYPPCILPSLLDNKKKSRTRHPHTTHHQSAGRPWTAVTPCNIIILFITYFLPFFLSFFSVQSLDSLVNSSRNNMHFNSSLHFHLEMHAKPTSLFFLFYISNQGVLYNMIFLVSISPRSLISST